MQYDRVRDHSMPTVSTYGLNNPALDAQHVYICIHDSEDSTNHMKS